MNRRLLLAGAASLVLLLTVLMITLLIRANRGAERDIEAQRYTERELLMPGNRLRFDEIERELLEPQPRGLAEPGQPLDPALVQELEIDTLEELDRELLRRAEAAIEEWLRE